MPRQRLLRARLAAKVRMIGLYCRCRARTVRRSSRRSWVWAKTSHVQKTRSHSCSPISPNSFSADSPSVCALKSRRRCAQHRLAAFGGKMGVRPPPIRGHDRRGVGQQFFRVVLVAAWLDREVGVAGIEHPP